MDDRPLLPAGDEHDAEWADQVRRAAAAFHYPATPDIAGRTAAVLRDDRRHSLGRALRPHWALAVALLIVIAGLMAVPQVRAAVLQALRIGAVRILPGAAPLPTPAATIVPLTSVLDLAGETTLEGAAERVRFPVRVPRYPPDLPPPDAVFVQQTPSQVVVMVWRDPEQPGEAGLSLYQIDASGYFQKEGPIVIEETQVGGLYAVWATGPHLLQNRDGDLEFRRLVKGNVLIWSDGKVTYRLETVLGLEEARRIAESLH